MILRGILLTVLTILTLPQPALAEGDAASGRKKATQCQACHGLDGMAKLPDAPNLAGQNPVYLAKALNDYKSGSRKHEVMSVAAATLSGEDVADLVAFYSSIKISISPAP